MPKIDLSMLNQRQTPAFYADVLANRPAAGFIGRIFVSTNTYAFYRDNGTGWDLIGGPGTGTVTGSGAANQVAFWSGASLITGENNLWWDDVNNYLGVGTNTPGAAIDAHSSVNVIQQLNQTVATNNSLLAFQNGGAGLWRIGNFYNSGANDFGVYDVVSAIQPVTIKKTTGQVLIGTSTVGAGKLVVASASSDNGIQIVGATAPSLRLDNAETGPTKRAGLGISTGVNNFIQGSADRDFCIFNGSTAAASPILFGVYDAGATNVQEAARISAARNFLIGTTTDAGQKLQVNGTVNATGFTVGAALQWNAMFYTAGAVPSYIQVANGSTGAGSANGLLVGLDGGGNAYLNQQSPFSLILRTNGINALTVATTGAATFNSSIDTNGYLRNTNTGSDNAVTIANDSTKGYIQSTNAARTSYNALILNPYGANVLIGKTTDNGAKFQVSGTGDFSSTCYALNFAVTNGNYFKAQRNSGALYLNTLGYLSGTDDLALSFSDTLRIRSTSVTDIVYISSAVATFSVPVNIANTVTAAIGIASTHKVSILINGVQYYLLASNV